MNNKKYALGIDIGGTNIAIGLIDTKVFRKPSRFY